MGNTVVVIAVSIYRIRVIKERQNEPDPLYTQRINNPPQSGAKLEPAAKNPLTAGRIPGKDYTMPPDDAILAIALPVWERLWGAPQPRPGWHVPTAK
jgi:hypothetical protein